MLIQLTLPGPLLCLPCAVLLTPALWLCRSNTTTGSHLRWQKAVHTAVRFLEQAKQAFCPVYAPGSSKQVHTPAAMQTLQ